MKFDKFINVQGKSSSQIVLIKPLGGRSSGFIIESTYIKKFKINKKINT